jgi:hypothetical protein
MRRSERSNSGFHLRVGDGVLAQLADLLGLLRVADVPLHRPDGRGADVLLARFSASIALIFC